MAYVKLTDDGPDRFTVAGVTFDEETPVQEVPDALAEHLVEAHAVFEHADESDADTDENGDGDGPPDDVDETGVGTVTTEDVTDEARETDHSGVDTEEVGEDSQPAREADDADGDAEPDEWDGWNEDDWLEMDYPQRAEDVREGRVDDHLDDIKAAETSETVTDAIGERRAELEE